MKKGRVCSGGEYEKKTDTTLKKNKNRLIQKINDTDFTNENSVFDLALQLEKVSRELRCKIIQSNEEYPI